MKKKQKTSFLWNTVYVSDVRVVFIVIAQSRIKTVLFCIVLKLQNLLQLFVSYKTSLCNFCNCLTTCALNEYCIVYCTFSTVRWHPCTLSGFHLSRSSSRRQLFPGEWVDDMQYTLSSQLLCRPIRPALQNTLQRLIADWLCIDCLHAVGKTSFY